MFDVDREKERSIAHKKFNITNQTSIQHLQTFSIKRQLAMYRYRLTEMVLHMYRSRTTKKTRTEIDLICTEVVMYRNCPPLCTQTVMYRKRPNPMVTHQLQVERRTAKTRRLKTDVLPLGLITHLGAKPLPLAPRWPRL